MIKTPKERSLTEEQLKYITNYLAPTAFKLWTYYYFLEPNWDRTKAHEIFHKVIVITGIKALSTYYKAFNELERKGVLVHDGGVIHFIAFPGMEVAHE